jgi:hypothetical protein
MTDVNGMLKGIAIHATSTTTGVAGPNVLGACDDFWGWFLFHRRHSYRAASWFHLL